MNKLIKISLIAVLSLLTIGISFAQRGHKEKDPEARATKMTERLTETLELNESQATKIKTIYLKYGERKKAMRDQDERSEKRTEMQQMRTDMEKEIKAVLTAGQIEKFEALPKRERGHRGKKGAGKQHKDHGARKAFNDEKITPILLEQRAKLDSKISATDQTRLVEIRVEVAQQKADMKAKHQERKASHKKGERPSPEAMKQHKADRKAQREARQNDPLRLEIKAMTKKYQSDIESLLAEVEPQIKALKEERKAERKEGKAKGKKGQHEGRKKEGKHGEKDAQKAKKGERKYAHFLLLDPNASVSTNKGSMISAVSIYPNPSQGISQVEYTLKTSSAVTIELHDKSGNLLKTMEQGVMPAGKNKTTINLDQYTVGVYYVILKDANGQTISKKVIR